MSSTIGSAPLSNASTSSRSRRRWFGAHGEGVTEEHDIDVGRQRVGDGSGSLERCPAHERRAPLEHVLDPFAVSGRHDPVTDGDVGTDVANPLGTAEHRRRVPATCSTRGRCGARGRATPGDPSASHADSKSAPQPRAWSTDAVTDGDRTHRQPVAGATLLDALAPEAPRVRCQQSQDNLLVRKQPTRHRPTVPGYDRVHARTSRACLRAPSLDRHRRLGRRPRRDRRCVRRRRPGLAHRLRPPERRRPRRPGPPRSEQPRTRRVRVDDRHPARHKASTTLPCRSASRS